MTAGYNSVPDITSFILVYQRDNHIKKCVNEYLRPRILQ